MSGRSGPLSAAQEFEWFKAAWEAARDTDVQHTRYFDVVPPAGTTVDAAVSAVTALVARHEALRTGIPRNGLPVQTVHPPAPPVIVECDAGSDYVHRLKLACRAVADGPMLRVGLVRDGDLADRICFTLPHTLTDRSSEDTLTRELLELLAGRPLPDPGSQQLDAALGSSPPGSRRYWEGAVATMPSRLFVPEHEGRFVAMDARLLSTRMPALLAEAARAYAVSPAVVFEAVLHLAVALAAGRDRTVVRSHFLGRGPGQRDAVGCFAKIIPSVVDLTGEPSLGTVVARTASARLRAQRHSGISYLTLRELMMAEELRRGTVFAEGVTVNLIEDESVSLLPARDDMWFLPEEPARPDLCGFDAYLNTFIGTDRLKIEACFNRDSVSREQAATVLLAPERILEQAMVSGDLTWSGMLEAAGVAEFAPTLPGQRRAVPVRGGDPRALLTAVEEVCRPGAAARPELSYLQNGGTLGRLPMLVHRLASAGLGELTVHDFLRPVPLGELAPAEPAIFRWALWNAGPDPIEMLSHSIGTFQNFFGTGARYVVHTDAVDDLASALKEYGLEVEVAPIVTAGSQYFEQRAIDGKVHVPWLKWGPRMRLRPTATEIYVDSDVFLLDEPAELRAFIRGNGTDFLVSQEEAVDPQLYGNFAARLPGPVTPINTGLFGQRPGADLSGEFGAAYRWWQTRVPDDEVSYFDEQGAVLWSLRHALAGNRVTLLDPLRYRVVCDRTTPPVETVGGLVALHATFGPVHPAYRRFLAEISAVSGIPESRVSTSTPAC